MAAEYARLSLLVNHKHQLPALVLGKDEPSDPYGLAALGAGNHDFSILVELRRSHQTQHAAEGVRTRDSVKTNRLSESVRCKLIREMNGLLRQYQSRAVGTGQDRNLRWQTSSQGTSVSGPGYQHSTPAATGNSANAAAIAALKHRKVFVRSSTDTNTIEANRCSGT